MHTCLEFLRKLAARLRSLARSSFDLTTAGEVRRAAVDIETQADEVCRGDPPRNR